MLNAIDFSGFVTLTLWHFVTPQQLLHWLLINSKCNLFKFNSLCHVSLLTVHIVWHSVAPLSSVLRLALLIIVIRFANMAQQMF